MFSDDRSNIDNMSLSPSLANDVFENAVQHAYLFCGEDSVAQARLFAMAINCTDSRDGNPCGICPVCRRTSLGSYADLIVIQPQKGWIRIDQIRDMQSKVFLRSMEGGKKVIIIEDADFMKTEAANSLLKVLEEPPEDTVFILCAATKDKLLPTIISRCLFYHFGKEGSFVIDPASLAVAEEKVLTFFSLLNGGVVPILNFADSFDKNKDKEGLLYFFIALWQKLAADAKNEVLQVSERELAMRSAMFAERAVDLLRRNINQRLLCDVTLIRLWLMYR